MSFIFYVGLYIDDDSDRFWFLYNTSDDDSDRIWWKYTKRIIKFIAFAPANFALLQSTTSFRKLFKKD
jgi:hypothetical protein